MISKTNKTIIYEKKIVNLFIFFIDKILQTHFFYLLVTSKMQYLSEKKFFPV